MRKLRSPRTTGALAAIAAAGAAVTMLAGTAQAATPGTFTLCSKGSYGSFAEFPERGGLATAVVPSGQCHSFKFGGDKAEPVQIRVAAEPQGGQVIGGTVYDGRAGLNIATVDGPSFYSF
ncbi:hypothetical protein [Saccharopolyspora rosea]|uniref:Secreted protein n=1 Tax=Saccharopolyspora rosea TaxID=524884 RepID=A0ABW3FSZ6_9PSEU|nr:hypothetical protein [Saccharopolyspora rosea]